MGGKLDQIKGRIKEAAGALTDDDNLKGEGNLDQAAGKVKEKAEQAMDKIKNALTAQRTSQQGGLMRMGRPGKRRGDRIGRPAMLVLLPCLCDLNGSTTGGLRLTHARERRNA
jgi:uncharacterized protein YjbJ (UPF0337 family)